MKRLTDEQVKHELQRLKAWKFESGFLFKKFVFKDFIEAFAFMTKVAMHAEKANHHPDWSNVYRTVEIKLRTHDADGITLKDIHMAEVIEEIWA
jgi:4a-hydroxytetrahydrobiopterin dehydratase